ncbi:hypothetical protein DLH88_23995 [Vibrio parahaemolyticus]|uniref:hypothetical protein n=3 Tax=Vibrio TaxID=662 RepID=UPI0009A4E18F|nr:hypothetical protein [Vibrio parahaemolyticus]EGR2913492.1 hypothetical protein [Vibrio parahaemolyticus]EGR3154867.1 hypothetical protein [Vibrio parahaemolyticus]EGW0146612.1 hypothetical protein [Vibrio parahaemolyticus]EJG1815158.1 hypothetical protein [Vibrio parahaemolyticus]EKO1852722.1 hypothetical protein [Vibrio parahaemolyticus]
MIQWRKRGSMRKRVVFLGLFVAVTLSGIISAFLTSSFLLNDLLYSKMRFLEVDRHSQNDITMLVALEFAELAEQRDYEAILNRACIQLDLVSGRLDFSKSQESLIVQERLKERDIKAIETVKRLKDLGYCEPES